VSQTNPAHNTPSSLSLSFSLRLGLFIVLFPSGFPITILNVLVLIRSVLRWLVTANVVPRSLILVTLMTEAILFLKRQLFQEPHGVASQKTALFIVSAVEPSYLTQAVMLYLLLESLVPEFNCYLAIYCFILLK
jgi:hypothetical protein